MKLKKVMAATLATMMCLSSFSMMNVWADKKEDSEPLVINYISARGETDSIFLTINPDQQRWWQLICIKPLLIRLTLAMEVHCPFFWSLNVW